MASELVGIWVTGIKGGEPVAAGASDSAACGGSTGFLGGGGFFGNLRGGFGLAILAEQIYFYLRIAVRLALAFGQLVAAVSFPLGFLLVGCGRCDALSVFNDHELFVSRIRRVRRIHSIKNIIWLTYAIKPCVGELKVGKFGVPKGGLVYNVPALSVRTSGGGVVKGLVKVA